MLSLQNLHLPLAGWTQIQPAEIALRWRNSAGDQLSLDFFDLAPDLPAPLDTLTPLRRVYREALGDEGGLVEVEATAVPEP